MTAIVAPAPADQVVTLDNVSWETYERLLAEHDPCRGKRFTYDDGVLQIMVLSIRHEHPSEILKMIVSELASEWEIDVAPAGSMTVKRADLRKGFEPDASYYFREQEMVRQLRDFDFTVDPPPDLVIEVDVTSGSLDKFPIFAAVGVREVWRYHEGQVGIFLLQDGRYTAGASVLMPPVTAGVLTRFVEMSAAEPRPKWIAELRRWARPATGR